jgi:hypothetical protein
VPKKQAASLRARRVRPCSDFDSVVKLKNFIFNKASFAVECGRFGKKLNAVKNKIGQLQPRNQNLNKV